MKISKIITPTVFFIGLLLIVQSCEKDEEVKSPEKEREIEITELYGNWEAYSHTIKAQNNPDIIFDYSSDSNYFGMNFDDCDSKNSEACVTLCTTIFEGDTIEENIPMTYKITDEETKISFVDNDFKWNILELSKNSLKVTRGSGNDIEYIDFKKN